jgi:WD40 repeat protein
MWPEAAACASSPATPRCQFRGVQPRSGGSWLGSYEEIKLWEVAKADSAHPLRPHQLDVESVAFSPDGRLLASGSCGKFENDSCVQGEIKLWDISDLVGR